MSNFQDFEEFRRRRRAAERGESTHLENPIPNERKDRPRKKRRKWPRFPWLKRKGAGVENNSTSSLQAEESETQVPVSAALTQEHAPAESPVWYLNKWFYGIVLAIFLVILLLLSFLPVPFGHVSVEGNQRMAVEDVLRVAGVNRPVNILQLSTSDMTRRLSGDLRVANVRIEREFPMGIRIHLEERQPIAVIQSEFGFAVLDNQGFVISEGREIKNTAVPFISGKKLGNILLGDQLGDPVLQKALLYLKSLSPNGWNQISEVNIANPQQITAYTRDDLAIHLGSGENMPEQAPLSENMLKDIRARHLEVLYIDANVGSPYIKLK